MTNLQTLHARLESAAYKVTDNFCYGCYKVVEGEFCPTCHSDDFMRHLSGVGVEYGCEWVNYPPGGFSVMETKSKSWPLPF